MELILTSPVTEEQKRRELLSRKIDRGVKLLRMAEKVAKENSDQPLELCYSGGKDSDVILHLAKIAGINYRTIYKNTTIDPPGTPAHAKSAGAEIIRPEQTFRELVIKKGLPTRFQRFCCAKLKEYKILDYAIMGVRTAESAKRAKRYTEPEQCRQYSKSERVRQYFPILDWDNEDVKMYIFDNNISCHPLYYNERGEFCVERRVGCMCCPLASNKKRVADFMQHPNMLKLYINALKAYREMHPYRQEALLNDIYKEMAFTLFATNAEDFRLKFGGSMFDAGIDCKAFLEDYFNVELKKM